MSILLIVVISSEFRSKNLVFIPSDVGGKWVPPTNCVWEGPNFLRCFFAVKDIYPQANRLFTSVLKVKDIDLICMKAEAGVFNINLDLSFIAEFLQEMEKLIKDNTPGYEISDTHQIKMFPVRESHRVSGYQHLRNTTYPTDWFIADTTHLETSFQGRVNLLALKVPEVVKLKRLLKAAKAEPKRLSYAAKGTARTVGTVHSWVAYTNNLRRKVDSILR
jgi:hypothetical protein